MAMGREQEKSIWSTRFSHCLLSWSQKTSRQLRLPSHCRTYSRTACESYLIINGSFTFKWSIRFSLVSPNIEVKAPWEALGIQGRIESSQVKGRETPMGDVITPLWLWAAREGCSRHWETLPGNGNNLQGRPHLTRHLKKFKEASKETMKRRVFWGEVSLCNNTQLRRNKAYLDRFSVYECAYSQWGEIWEHSTQWDLHHTKGFRYNPRVLQTH